MSDKNNPEIFEIRGHTLFYESDQLIPSKSDNLPPLLLIFGNPASHSIHAGMFFASEGTRITVELILEKLAAGETFEHLLDAHPRLTRYSGIIIIYCRVKL